MKTKTADFSKRLARVQRSVDAGTMDRALAELEKMLKTWPEHPRLLLMKGWLIQLSENGSLKEAKRALQRAADLDANSPEPWIELGYLHLVIDDQAKAAEADFDHAIALSVRVLLDAIKGKIDAIEDQSCNGRSAGKVGVLKALDDLVKHLAGIGANDLDSRAPALHAQIRQLLQSPNGDKKAERNGKRTARST